MRTRRWVWLRLLIVGLITRPPAGYVQVANPHGEGNVLRPLYANRLSALYFAEK